MNELESKIIAKLEKEKLSATWMIAGTLKITTVKARRIMLSLECRKKVSRHSFTSKNNIIWELTQN